MYVKGYRFPDHDIDCQDVVFSQVADLEKAFRHVENFGTAVQAGGNVGVWANYLSSRFKSVYTFEPDAENFDCLVENMKSGIFAYSFGLGDQIEQVGIHTEHENCGANYIVPGMNVSIHPLDNMRLTECDLIVLDVEGYEEYALAGALDTITKFSPVIMYEDKGLGEKYTGNKQGYIETIMQPHGYQVVDRVHRDVILAHRPC